MRLTKQRLREIILEEIGEIDVQSQEEDPERLLRREIRESKRALAAAMKQFVQLQNEQPGTRPEWGPRMLSKFVDNWITEFRGW
jgi:hypothetical protein